jgi:tetratricopeptide (TPR) repeat protein
VLAKRPGSRRILLLGDSVVEGYGIPEIDDTMGRVLETELGADDHEVLNFGVSGYCTRAEVELLADKGLRFDPDDVVVVFTANDFDNFNREAVELDFGRERPAAVRAFFDRSHLFRLAAVRLDLWSYGLESDPLARHRETIGDRNVLDGLRLLRELADRERFRPWLAIWPLFLDEAVIDPHPVGDGERLVVEAIAASFRIPTIRLSPTFREHVRSEAIDNPRRAFTIGDGLHPSRTGARIAAFALSAALAADPPSVAPAPLDPDVVRQASNLQQTDATYARVLVNRALRLRRSGRPGEAKRLLHEAIGLEPDAAEAHNNLANLLLDEGRVDEAVSHYRAALRVEPYRADIQENLAALYARRYRWEEAAAHFTRAAEERESSPDTWRRAAEARLRASQPDLAIEAYRRAVDAGLDDLASRVNLANAYTTTGRIREALNEYRFVLAREPDRLSALLPAARILAASPDPSLREPRAAVTLARQAHRVTNGRDPRAVEALVVALASAGERDEAVAVLDRGIRMARQRGIGSWVERLERLRERFDAMRVADR